MPLKKHIGFLLLSAMLLAGCSEKGNDTSISPSENSESVSEVVDVPSEPSSVKENVTYRWDKNTDKLLKESLGEYVTMVPVLDALFYDSANVTAEDESYTYTVIGCVGDEPETMLKLYRATLKLSGFDVTYNETNKSYGTYARIDFSHILFITFMDMQDAGGEDSGVVICTWIYQDKDTSFPMNLVQSLYSTTIPTPEAQYYQGQVVTGYGDPFVLCCCYGTTVEQATNYGDALRQDGFIEDAATGAVYGGANFNHPDKNITVVYYYYTADEAKEEGFEGDMPVLQMLVYGYTPTENE